MIRSSFVQATQDLIAEAIITYVIFSLSSAAAGLWLNAARLHDRYRAYYFGMVLLLAATLLVVYSPVTWCHGAFAVGITAIRAVIGLASR